MSEELLACPFCGGDGEIVVDYVLGPNEPLYAPMCEHYADWWENRFVKKYPNGPICQGSAGTNFHTKEEAIAAWNRRTQPATGQQGQWEPIEDGWYNSKWESVPKPDTPRANGWTGYHIYTPTDVDEQRFEAWLFGAYDLQKFSSDDIRLCRLTNAPQDTAP
jgi:hypothetical protein